MGKWFEDIDSEELTLSNYTYRIDGSYPSRYVKGLFITKTHEELKCPACARRQEVPEHGVKGGCVNCDLKWVVFGNSLNIWKDV